MNVERRLATLLPRVAMALLFLVSAYNKVTGSGPTQAYMEAYGVPGILVWPAALWEMTAGVCLLLGLLPRLVTLGLVGWCLLTAAIFHRNWADGMQQMHFFKNITMAGAFAILAMTDALRLDSPDRQVA